MQRGLPARGIGSGRARGKRLMPVQRIVINPSARLAIAACAVHAAAATAVWLAPIALWLKAGLTLAMTVSLVLGLFYKAALHAAEAIVALEIAEDGRMSFQTRRGKWRECELLQTSYVSPQLTILNLKPRDGLRTRHVVLVPDNVDAHEFRRLRTLLRWGLKPEIDRL